MRLSVLMFLSTFAITTSGLALVFGSGSSLGSSAALCLTLTTMNVGVHGFFGFFRRRNRATPSPLPDRDLAFGEPSGPISRPFFRRGSSFFNQFTYGNNFAPPLTRRQWPMSLQDLAYQQQVAEQMKNQDIPQDMREQVLQQMQQQQQQPDLGFEFRPGRSDDPSPSLNPDEAESFFTLLAETDESQCISRLVCEMGADPMTGGEFGQTVVEIISNLRDFPEGSKVAYFNEILQLGLSNGLKTCSTRFSSCDDNSLQMVKNAQVST